MIRTVISATMIAASCLSVVAQETNDTTPDEAAIRKNVAAYVQAFNKGDAAAVARQWSDEGEWVAPNGARFRGRQAIRKELEAYFQTGKAPRIKVPRPSIRFLTPRIAVEEGTARLARPNEPPSVTKYVAVHVKQEGEWKLESVQETEVVVLPSNFKHLKALEWMVGTWIDQDEHTTIETTCAWTKRKNFFTRSFVVKAEGRPEMEGTQVIGWDPVDKRIRSWVFDSAGGYGEGTWTQKGDRWVVRASYVLQGGDKASSINIFTPIDENSFTWQSIGRESGGELLPNIGPVTVVRR